MAGKRMRGWDWAKGCREVGDGTGDCGREKDAGMELGKRMQGR